MECGVGMELTKTQNAGAAQVHRIIDRFGCLPSIEPLNTLARFDPLEVAQAIEANLAQSAIYGHVKITIHLDLPDAHALAQALRRK